MQTPPRKISSVLIAMWTTLLELAPWLLLGALIGGVLHVALPANLVRQQLRGGWGVVKAVALGVPLPLCSCGVIPTALGLRRAGASQGSTLAFLVSTPQTGVDSILVSASFLGWPFALFKVGCAALTGLVAGWLGDAVDRSAPEPAAEPTSASLAPKRGVRELFRHALELLETIWHWLVFGVVVSAAITVYVPPGLFRELSPQGELLAMLVTLLVAVPLYVCATASVPIAAALVASGLPPGAALVFLMAGPATNMATIGAVYRTLGGRALAVYLGVLVVGSVSLGLVFDGWFAVSATQVAHEHLHGESSWGAVASAVLLLGLLTWFAGRELEHRARAWLKRPTTGAHIEVEVGGMTCAACVARLERKLAAAEGVADACVLLEPGKAIVNGTVTVERVRELVNEAGFEARG